jgi:hypothetical protein
LFDSQPQSSSTQKNTPQGGGGGGAQAELAGANSPQDALPIFGEGLIPETQVVNNQHLPAKRPRMSNDPDWVQHRSGITPAEENRVISVRKNAVKYVS